MLKFISFGSGSSGNCYLLYTETSALMIDSGVGVRILKRHFRDHGISFSRINGILVTHDHADHVKSVGYISGEYNIPVYALDSVHRGIEKNFCVRKKVVAECKREVCAGETFQIEDFTITPFIVPHDSNGNLGYRIEVEDKTFCLMTDVGHITDDIKSNIHSADYLVIEANHDEQMLQNGPYPQYLKERVAGDTGHLSNTRCANALAENASEKLKHVWLCHLSEENNHPELLRKTMEEILSASGIKLGTSLKLDILKRRQPSEIFDL